MTCNIELIYALDQCSGGNWFKIMGITAILGIILVTIYEVITKIYGMKNT